MGICGDCMSHIINYNFSELTAVAEKDKWNAKWNSCKQLLAEQCLHLTAMHI